jgi:uncharacterized protein
MRLDLGGLALRNGERYECVYNLEIDPVVLGGAEYQAIVPDGAMVTIDRVAGGFVIDLVIDARIFGPCSRCLGEAEVPVHAEQQEFAPTAPGGWTDSEACVFINDLVLDVGGLAREALVLAVPGQVLCSASCEGLCPQCGKNMNEGPCSCRA